MCNDLPDSVSSADFDRYVALADKMGDGGTADLTPNERAFYRRVYAALDDHLADNWPATAQCPAAFLGGDDYDCVGMRTDAAW